jgi:hypothetical protein
MKISIEYESSWRNSFLDGSNNEPLPKQGRKFIGSMKSLGKPENFLQRSISLDTVMGVLNRLIGDQRKLYQSRSSDNYYFKEIESLVEFEDKPKVINQEMTFIRNITGSEDQNSFTGLVKVNDPIFNSDYSQEFWGILALDLTQLCKFINNDTPVTAIINCDPITIIEKLEELNKLKVIENSGEVQEAFNNLNKHFDKFNGLNNKGLVFPISLYCSALYLQLNRLSQKNPDDYMSTAKTKAGGISGISNNRFTKKDFMVRYTTGAKKKIWGNPYIREEFIKGEGKVKHLMSKASGKLEIEINIEKEQGREILELIENAGVSSFYLGKKGLAYVTKIRV